MFTRINPTTGVVEELRWSGWRERLNSSGNAERTNPKTGVLEERGYSGWREKSDSGGSWTRVNRKTGVAEKHGTLTWQEGSERINPQTGIIEERRILDWGSKLNENGKVERINRHTGVIEELGLFGWREKPAQKSTDDPHEVSVASSAGGSTGEHNPTMWVAGFIILLIAAVVDRRCTEQQQARQAAKNDALAPQFEASRTPKNTIIASAEIGQPGVHPTLPTSPRRGRYLVSLSDVGMVARSIPHLSSSTRTGITPRDEYEQLFGDMDFIAEAGAMTVIDGLPCFRVDTRIPLTFKSHRFWSSGIPRSRNYCFDNRDQAESFLKALHTAFAQWRLAYPEVAERFVGFKGHTLTTNDPPTPKAGGQWTKQWEGLYGPDRHAVRLVVEQGGFFVKFYEKSMWGAVGTEPKLVASLKQCQPFHPVFRTAGVSCRASVTMGNGAGTTSGDLDLDFSRRSGSLRFANPREPTAHLSGTPSSMDGAPPGLLSVPTHSR